MRKIFSKLYHLSFTDVVFFLEAYLLLMLASIVKATLPFRWYANFFGGYAGEKSEKFDNKLYPKVRAVILAVRRGSKYMPFECKCLVRAIAGKAMLRMRGIPSTVYFGVAKDEKDMITAHAWLMAGKMYVTGGSEKGNYKIISTFADGNDGYSTMKAQ